MEEKKEMMKGFEKPFYRSKKFIAFLVMEGLLAWLAYTALKSQPDLGWPLASFMLGIVMTMGAIALVFNGYQAKLDMFMRGMALGSDAAKSIAEKVGGGKMFGSSEGGDENV